jgi:hypothetical protein
MKNSYILIGVVIIIAILAFVFGKNKIEAPTEVEADTDTKAGVALTDGEYVIDTEKSVIKWRGEFVTGMGEEGTVLIKAGHAHVLAGAVTDGDFVIDMNTIKDNGASELLEKHLKSDDFFAVETYPESTFIITKVAPSSVEGGKAGRYIITGNLKVKGIEKAISFPATITRATDGSLKAVSSFAINRANWQVKYNSQSFFSGLGNKAIRDAVEIALDLSAIKE